MVFPAFTSVSRYTHLRQDNVGEEVSRYLLESSAQRLLLDMIFSLNTKNTTMASGKMRIDSMGRLLLETIEQGLATRIGRVPLGHSNGRRYCAETDINPYFGIAWGCLPSLKQGDGVFESGLGNRRQSLKFLVITW